MLADGFADGVRNNLDGTLATVRRVLNPGGVFAFSILRPCFPGVSNAWPSDGSYYAERWW
ncbi:hypothetical protein BWI15_35120 [Kribbella sp. ALI-6-A]|uniref:hypothetical protein n=1 Tax=Kribbella sp. ALI-6-A TaxID=1933817 RepID=UPI00097C36B7|nr:hypothetical protein [Kribbella sp. ALI-6-A]ONI68256.1 hypothetical protein BWI15_35120 [Kribbella sp. ALI-6-A]